MSHFSEDELLKYALEMDEDLAMRAEAAEHLAVCRECRTRLDELREDIEIIGGVRPIPPVLRILRQQTRFSLAFRSLKAAALVIFGITVGLGASKWIDRQPAAVWPAYTALSPLPDSVSSYAVADATGISAKYFERILERRE